MSHICLHSLVRVAAEVPGAKAEEEVPGWRGQKWTKICLEQASDKGCVLQLGVAQLGNSHFSESLKGV